MKAGAEQESATSGAAKKDYLGRAREELDRLVEEWFGEGYEQAKVSPPNLAAKAGINYNTWHKNGVTPRLVSDIEALSYKKKRGIFVDIQEYVEDREEFLDVEKPES